MTHPISPTLTRTCVAAVLAICTVLHGQNENELQNAADQKDQLTTVQFPNTPIPTILLYYESITGKKVIRDAAVQDKSLIIQTSGKLTREKAAEFIEKSFLLNGYALVPTEEEGQMKIIAFGSTDKKDLSSEALPVYTNPYQLPDSEQVVTYIMMVDYLTPDEAKEAFEQVTPLHPYGKVTPLKNAKAIVITENSTVIKRMIALKDYLDVSPVRSIDRMFQLERADAEEVVEALSNLLDLDDTDSTGTAGSQGKGAQGQAGAQNQTQANAADLASQLRGESYSNRTSLKPKVHAIPRANSILVVASPADIDYIAGIITHLDAPAESSTFMRRRLNYLSVSQFLQIAENTLRRGLGGENQETSQITGGDGNNQGTLQGGGQGSTGGSTTGGFGNNGSSSYSGQNGSLAGAGASFGAAGRDPDMGPQSIVIDKTLLVADNAQNVLIGSGPPEHLEFINRLLDEMDCEPDQIQISAVIAQLNLSDDYELGFDMLRSLPTANTSFDGAGSFRSRPSTNPLVNVSGSLTSADSLIAAASQGLTAYFKINDTMDAFVSALEATNRFKVLSRPTVYTQNNKVAVIQTGQRVAVPRSTLSSIDVNNNNNANQIVTANIDYENVLLRVEVVPLINNDGQITLRINQSNDDIIGSQIIGGDEIPTIGTQALGTTIMVPNGGTVLLGGLISEEETKTESGLPLFTSLPLVGRVFGSTQDSIARQELLIFIQPKIISSTFDYFKADRDTIDRTRVGVPSEEFSYGTDDNLPAFESQEFNSPEKRVHFFKRLFQKKGTEEEVEQKPTPSRLRAVPYNGED